MKQRRRIRVKAGSLRLYVMLAMVAITAGVIGFLRSNFFVVESVVVKGVDGAIYDAVLDACPVMVGDHQFSFSSGKVAKEMADKLVTMSEVKVSRSLPNTVTITVSQRVSAMIIYLDGIYYEVDATGFVYSASDKYPASSAMLVTGLSDIEIAVGDKFRTNQAPATATAYDVIQILEKSNLNDKASELACANDGYYLYTTNANVVKFQTRDDFTANERFIGQFLNYDERQILVELVEGQSPVYKLIDID